MMMSKKRSVPGPWSTCRSLNCSLNEKINSQGESLIPVVQKSPANFYTISADSRSCEGQISIEFLGSFGGLTEKDATKLFLPFEIRARRTVHGEGYQLKQNWKNEIPKAGERRHHVQSDQFTWRVCQRQYVHKTVCGLLLLTKRREWQAVGTYNIQYESSFIRIFVIMGSLRAFSFNDLSSLTLSLYTMWILIILASFKNLERGTHLTFMRFFL